MLGAFLCSCQHLAIGSLISSWQGPSKMWDRLQQESETEHHRELLAWAVNWCQPAWNKAVRLADQSRALGGAEADVASCFCLQFC